MQLGEREVGRQRFVGQLDERMALIIDPMLATGGSLIATIDMLKRLGAKQVRALVLVAAPEGIAAVSQAAFFSARSNTGSVAKICCTASAG